MNTIIEERLEKLEREFAAEKRRSRWLLSVAVVAVAGLVLGWTLTMTTPVAQAAATAKIVRANKFILEDENGKTRGALGSYMLGVGLSLLDEHGKIRVGMTVLGDKAGPELLLYDENSNIRVGMTVLGDKSDLWLNDENGKRRAGLTLDKAGPELLLYDDSSKIRAYLGVAKPKTETTDGNTITYPESPLLLLFGPDGNQIWSTP